jgi:[ribosomal protein S5]-alanine N-acetyltransferase
MCHLHPWSLDDIRVVMEASNGSYISSVTTIEPGSNEEAARAWIVRQWSRSINREGISLAVQWQFEVVGAATLLRRSDPEVLGLGYWLVDRVRGRGVASSVVRLLAAWALKQDGVRRIEALVEPWDIASRSVLEKAGFSQDALLSGAIVAGGNSVDGLLYSLDPRTPL